MSTTLSRISFGPIKNISFSPDWTQFQPPGDVLLTRQLIKFQPPGGDDVEVSLFNRGLPSDAVAVEELRTLMQSTNGDIDLNAAQIQAMAPIMGTNNAGDNQYTNPSAKGSFSYPVFNLGSAKLISVNGRKVLSVRGNFQNEHAMPGNEFYGIFIESGGDIFEVFFQSSTKGKFLKHLKEFENALQSIEWY